MKKLTSEGTFFRRKIFPLLWFGFLGAFLCTGLFADQWRSGPGLMFLPVPAGLAVFGFFLMKKRVWDLMDEVYDEGTSLLCRKGGIEVRVSLKETSGM